ncbi:MAG: PQQ-like beta-propeller repeat protein [Chloroflexi bacterium]|nr:PQQ-like beta-propeller repeat protein [Chloroflexota bacterium]
MNKKTILVILAFTMGAVFLGACSGQVPINNWAGLAADANRAYLSSGSFVYAIDLGTGEEVWRYPQEADGKLLFFATPYLTSDGQLLIGSQGTEHAFVSINPETGRDNWANPFSGAQGLWVAAPLEFNGRIYAPNTDGFIYVLDLNGKPAGDPIEIGGALWSSPATDGTRMYVASLDHHLHIVDPETGISQQEIDLGGAVPSSPVVAEDGVYVGSFASRIDYVTFSGSRELVEEAPNWVWGTPVLDDDTLYYADLDGNIFSLDIPTGRQNWGAVKPDGPVVARLLVDGDKIFVATESGTFYALDRESKIVWEKELGGSIYTSPVSAGDLILVAPYKSEFALAAYDAQGRQAWTFTPEK